MRGRGTFGAWALASAAALGIALAGATWANDPERSGGSAKGTEDGERTRLDAPLEHEPLVQKVRKELQKREALREIRVSPDGEDGVALEGSVASSMEREEATRVARTVSGVEHVENRLQIGRRDASESRRR